ncbi:trehalose/maltose hydrolase or phosphorylase [Flammeovirgaceae bacterium 311]|nr:trehalose/maltose hydrolase or phosphorylase [Flammeovirgaceae bacterium 311]
MSTDQVNIKDWSITYQHYDPADEGRREALFAIGNGYLVSRAAAPEASEEAIHYPGTYKVGCYNRLSTMVEDQEVENESLVNLPNWLPLSFRINGGSWFSADGVELLSYQQELNMKVAVLLRRIHFRDEEGRETKLLERRFVSMAQPHLMGLQLELEALNWSGLLEVRSGLDGNVQNNNVERYSPFRKQHLETVYTRSISEESLELVSRTLQSRIDIALTARTRIRISGQDVDAERKTDADTNRIICYLRLQVETGAKVQIEKIAALHTSQDQAIAHSSEAARKTLAKAEGFDELLEEHRRAWEQLWEHCKLDMALEEQLPYFRLHMFQILQNISRHTTDLDVGIPPSGWQGEEYHGHIFWDELFIFPFLAYRFPTTARASLLYRYRRLDEARTLAEKAGCRGAMFPWRSASSGREETPLLQYNLYSGHWMQDDTYLQHHIGSIIAYSIANYVEVTNDQQFLAEYGAEMILEIARFWASKAIFNPERGRYEIKGVVGPDEHHTRYPKNHPLAGSSGHPGGAGINNNTYTNVMAAWTLGQAGRMYSQLPEQRRQELAKLLDLQEDEPAMWDNVKKNMYLPVLEEGMLEQFEGFSKLEDFYLQQYRQKHDYNRIDWTLEAEGDSVANYKLAKQADTSLLLYLFPPAELLDLLQEMGYSISIDDLHRTIQHQIAYTANESSLSRIVFAGALAHLDPQNSWKYFKEAQYIDLSPEEDNGSSEGIHLGAMGGTLGVLQHHYLGIEVISNTLVINPALPPELDWVKIGLTFHGVAICCTVSSDQIEIRSEVAVAASIKVGHVNQVRELYPGTTVTFNLEQKS